MDKSEDQQKTQAKCKHDKPKKNSCAFYLKKVISRASRKHREIEREREREREREAEKRHREIQHEIYHEIGEYVAVESRTSEVYPGLPDIHGRKLLRNLCNNYHSTTSTNKDENLNKIRQELYLQKRIEFDKEMARRRGFSRLEARRVNREEERTLSPEPSAESSEDEYSTYS